MLTRGDDYPIHQTAEPLAHAGTDRNFYDRYFFNGYEAAGDSDAMFAVAFGVYPQLNIADAAFCWMQDGRQVNLHASRWLEMERMELSVGPIRIEVLEPLRRLRVTVEAPDQGVRAELTFEGRSFPIEEPRFTRRIGPRTFMDYTRLTQNGAYAGWIEVDGRRHDVSGFVGTRDRSWGVRPVGARDPQEPAPAALPQFFWLWTPCVFEDGDLFFHTNDDAHGRPWNRRAVWAPLGSAQDGVTDFDTVDYAVDWRPGTRHAARGTIQLPDGGEVVIEPQAEFFMLGLGYNHPVWGHGMNHGRLKVEREDLILADLDRALPFHLHVQALSKVTWRGADGTTKVGRGVFEQFALGPHATSGFKSVLDMAPMSDLKAGLEAYLTQLWGAPTAVTNLSRIPGGASRETYRLDADTGGVTRGMILRRDPPGSLIDTDRRLEFLAYRTVHGHAPVPQAIALEEDGGALERPFFLMERIDGGTVPSPFVFDPYGEHAQALGEQFFTILGKLAALDHEGTPIREATEAPAPEDCWRIALDHWSAVIEADEQHPQPIVRAAIRWLQRHPPPPAQRISIVHGDYRSGNFMHDGAGQILAILDWEMAHLGDPIEDLGWAFDPLWNHFDEGKVAGLIPQDQAIAIWEAASGLKVDPQALAWWSLFNAVKGQAIWTSAAREYRDGGFVEPILAISGWYTARRHDLILAGRLAALEGI